MRKLIPGFLALVLVSTLSQAATFTVTNTSGNPAYDAALTDIQNQLNSSGTPRLLGSQSDFAKGMFEASAFNNNSSRITSFQGYTLFAVMGGVNASVVSKDAESVDSDQAIIEKGDAYVGVSSAASLTIGLNLSPITMLMGLSDSSLYASVKMGGIPEVNVNNNSVKANFFGFGLTYMMIDTFGFVVGEWRGIALNSGFYRVSQEATMNLLYPDTITSGSLSFSPEVDIKTESTIYVVPVEVSTAISLLFFNVSLGGGFDYCFGEGDVTVDVVSDISAGGTQVGTVAINDAGVKGEKPTAFNPKIFGGLGLQFSVVKIDVPVTYYPKQKAYTLGASAGVVF